MKRYFDKTDFQEVVMIEFDPNSVFRTMDIYGIFGGDENIIELSKSEYRRRLYEYKKTNTTNLTMTISH